MTLEPGKDAPRTLQEQWTPERIKVEAELFLLDGGKLSRLSFIRRKRQDLLNKVETSYHGGLAALQEELKDFVTNKRTGVEKRITKQLLDYQAALLDGEHITFEEFLRKTGEYENEERMIRLLSQHNPRLRYNDLFTHNLTALAPKERRLLAKEYINQFSNIDIPMYGTGQDFWEIAQIQWTTIQYVTPGLGKGSFPSVDEKSIPPQNVEEAKELDVELELYELMSRINFCQYLLETSASIPMETYDRLIMQVNYSTNDAEKALRDQKPDEIVAIVREPFGCVLHHVEPYGNNRHGSRVRGVLYFRKADELTPTQIAKFFEDAFE